MCEGHGFGSTDTDVQRYDETLTARVERSVVSQPSSGDQVIELGPVNAPPIHKVDECVKATDLDLLTLMYKGMMRRLLPE